MPRRTASAARRALPQLGCAMNRLHDAVVALALAMAIAATIWLSLIGEARAAPSDVPQGQTQLRQPRVQNTRPPASSSGVPAGLASVSRMLIVAPVVRGEFVQTKTLKGFQNPLVSRGSFLVARQRGVLWLTRDPFVSTLVLTRDRLLSIQSDGVLATRIDAQSQPGLRAVNQLLFALISADLGTLSRQFRIENTPRPTGGWSLKLTPVDALLGQWIGSVILEGDRFVRVARFTEPQGDSSEIVFSEQTAGNALTAKEEARFE